jgi:hypothetical protein
MMMKQGAHGGGKAYFDGGSEANIEISIIRTARRRGLQTPSCRY